MENEIRKRSVANMDGYCERHHQPWDIKYVYNKWVCECPKCRAEGLLDTFCDYKTTMQKEEEWTVNNHIFVKGAIGGEVE